MLGSSRGVASPAWPRLRLVLIHSSSSLHQTPSAFFPSWLNPQDYNSDGREIKWRRWDPQIAPFPSQHEHFNSLSPVFSCSAVTLYSASGLFMLYRQGRSLFLSFHLHDIHPLFLCTAVCVSVSPGFLNLMEGSRVIGSKKGRKEEWKEEDLRNRFSSSNNFFCLCVTKISLISKR